MAAAWLSSMISSGDLITRASSIRCWQSTTVRPWRCISNRNAGSTMSTPTGRSATPASTSIDLISATASAISPTVGATSPRKPRKPARGGGVPGEAEEAGPVVLGRDPLGVLLVVLDRRAEVPEHRVLAAGQQGVPDHLVAEGAADPRLRGVPDVVEVEEQEGAALAGLQRRLRPAQPVVAQPGEVDPLLVVDAHVSGRRQGARHRSGLRERGEPVVDLDVLGRDLVAGRPGLQLQQDGEVLRRAALRDRGL